MVKPIEPLNWASCWNKKVTDKKASPEKLLLSPYVHMVGTALQGYVNPCDIDWHSKDTEFTVHFSWSNADMVLLSKGAYRRYYPEWFLYKNAPATEEAYALLKTRDGDKWPQPSGIFVKERPYTLFLLQNNQKRYQKHTLAYLKWCIKNNVYTIFKTHPSPSDNRHLLSLPKVIESLAKTYPCIKIADDVRTEEIIRQADRVVSVDSASSFKAILHDIPVCHLGKGTMADDLIPCVAPCLSILDLPRLPKIDKLKWLNWFYFRAVSDLLREDYQDGLLEKLWRYTKKGMDDYEAHTW